MINSFPGYEQKILDDGRLHNMYRGTDVGKGGYIISNQGIFENVALLDVNSMHPNSAKQMNCFGDHTKNFVELLDARVAIKHGDLDSAKKMLNGRLAPYLNDKSTSKDLAQALKIAINSVYGLTAASFDNPFRDIRNKNNIVALRGALFMKTLQDEIEKRDFKIVAIKTDSIKIAEATKEIIKFCKGFANEYGYTFEHEASYSRICQFNDADYVARYMPAEECKRRYGYVPGDNVGNDNKWTETGNMFKGGYIFKTMFGTEKPNFNDYCEVFEVKKSELYLDMNERLPDVSEYENELEKAEKKYREGRVSDTTIAEIRANLEPKIAEGHNYIFVGRVGQFCPIKPGCGGGILLAKGANGKYNSASGAKGYRWLESEMVQELGKETDIDKSFYISQIDKAIEAISQYGDFEWFASDDPYIPDNKLDFMNIPETDKEELPWD